LRALRRAAQLHTAKRGRAGVDSAIGNNSGVGWHVPWALAAPRSSAATMSLGRGQVAAPADGSWDQHISAVGSSQPDTATSAPQLPPSSQPPPETTLPALEVLTSQQKRNGTGCEPWASLSTQTPRSSNLAPSANAEPSQPASQCLSQPHWPASQQLCLSQPLWPPQSQQPSSQCTPQPLWLSQSASAGWVSAPPAPPLLSPAAVPLATPPLAPAADAARADMAVAAAAFAEVLAGGRAPRVYEARIGPTAPTAASAAGTHPSSSGRVVTPARSKSLARVSRSPAAKRRRLRHKAPPPAATSPSLPSSPLPEATRVCKLDTSVRSPRSPLFHNNTLADLSQVTSCAAGTAFMRLGRDLQHANEEHMARLSGMRQGASEVLALASEYRSACVDSSEALDGVLLAIESGLAVAGLVLVQGNHGAALPAFPDAVAGLHLRQASLGDTADAAPASAAGLRGRQLHSCAPQGLHLLGVGAPTTNTMRRRRQIDGMTQPGRRSTM